MLSVSVGVTSTSIWESMSLTVQLVMSAEVSIMRKDVLFERVAQKPLCWLFCVPLFYMLWCVCVCARVPTDHMGISSENGRPMGQAFAGKPFSTQKTKAQLRISDCHDVSRLLLCRHGKVNAASSSSFATSDQTRMTFKADAQTAPVQSCSSGGHCRRMAQPTS